MNNKLFLCLAVVFTVASLSLVSCVKKDITFQINLSELTYTADSIKFDGTTKTFGTKQYISGIQQKIKDNGGDIANLKSVKLKSLKADITSGQTFNGIDFVEMYIASTKNAAIKFAYKTSVPQTGVNTLDLDNQYAELSPFFKDDSMMVSIKGYNSINLPITTYKLSGVFDVTVGPGE